MFDNVWALVMHFYSWTTRHTFECKTSMVCDIYGVMAAVVICEPLCYIYNVLHKQDRQSILNTVSKFYHIDELSYAKSELAKCVPMTTATTIDGWGKLTTSKGTPVTRRGDGEQRRCQEADDLMQMILLLDVNQVDIPKFVAADLERLPGSLMKPADVPSPAGDINEVVRRLDVLEKSLSAINSHMLSVPAASSSSSVHHPTTHVVDSVHSASPTDSDLPPVRRWADHAVSLAAENPQLSFSKPNTKRTVRLRGRDTGSAVKGVPRQLVCFAGRLDKDVTESDLASFLQDKGITDVKCTKLVAKDGRVFRTSAFRVSCSAVYESIFYMESSWPEGVELRDWVFRNDGQQQ